MALDLSLTGTGLCVLSKNRVRYQYLRTDLIHNLPKRADSQVYNGKFYGTDEERIAYIVLMVMEEWRESQPDIVLIEGYSFGSKGRALSGLHELGGVMKHHLWAAEALWLPIAPTALKTYSTGNHRADKEAMLARARMMWPACPNHDVADAFLLARLGMRRYDKLVESVIREEAA
jgi:crossover junction endodeoxyribonuclease RuvC